MGAAQARLLGAVVQFLNLDPDYTSSARARANFRLAFKIALRRLDIPPRKRYSWEGETEEPGDSDAR